MQLRSFIFEGEVQMRIGPRMFAILAFGTLSTDVAVAGHHGHRAGGGAAASRPGTDPQSLAKSPMLGGGQRGAGPPAQGGAADHVNVGVAKDGSGLTGTDRVIGGDANDHTRKSAKTSVSATTVPDNAPPVAQGFHRAATPAPGAGGKQGDAGVAIDTRITVNQGRETIRGSKERPLKKPKLTTAPGIGLMHEPVHIFHQGSPVGSNGGPRRNAVGAAVEQDKVVERSRDKARGAAATITTIATAPGAGAVSHDHDTKRAIGSAPIDGSISGATQSSNHASSTAALKIVTANGPSVSGTGMIRPGSGVGAVGGPAKITAGAISGSSFRPKHL
jgi:hypothetical protein